MKERVRSLNEVTVPKVMKDFPAKVQKKLKKDYRKGRRQQAHYFWPHFGDIRSAAGDGRRLPRSAVCCESSQAESEFRAILGGRFAAQQQEGWETIHSPSLWVRSNLHKLFSLGPMVQDDKFWSWIIFPLPSSASPKHWKKYYKVTNQTLYDDDGRPRIYRIEMQRKDLKENAIPRAAHSMSMPSIIVYQRFDGTINHLVMFMKLAAGSHDYIPMDVSLHVDYRHDQGSRRSGKHDPPNGFRRLGSDRHTGRCRGLQPAHELGRQKSRTTSCSPSTRLATTPTWLPNTTSLSAYKRRRSPGQPSKSACHRTHTSPDSRQHLGHTVNPRGTKTKPHRFATLR